jgi:4-amino-4-deoxy-L-arabinose transferase-like glycosyltransferase
VLGVVLVVSALCRAYRLRTPNQAAIFDEPFYVNSARLILGIHVKGGPYVDQPLGLDPNHEHPPLGKALIAGSMRLFGDNGFGWRLPSLLAGIACIALVYMIVRALSEDGWLAVLAAGIFAFDNLVLVHSRIATLDMPMLAFLLLGVWCWLRGWPLAAGAACGFAGLVKETAYLGFGALLLLGLGAVAIRAVRERVLDRRALRASVLLVLSAAVVWFGGLWLLDLAFTKYDTPWAHLRAMLNYGFEIRGITVNNQSRPWRWLVNEVQMPYFDVVKNLTANGRNVGTRHLILFKGAMNPVLIGAAPLAISYVAWRAWRFRETLSIWVLVWVATTYLVYYPLVLFADRTTYLFYILLTIPALAVATAQLLRQSALPRVVTWGYLMALLVGFGLYYPFRGVL